VTGENKKLWLQAQTCLKHSGGIEKFPCLLYLPQPKREALYKKKLSKRRKGN